MSKPIKTKKNRIEKTKRTEAMKHPRRCIVCSVTKDAEQFSRTYLYVCKECHK